MEANQQVKPHHITIQQSTFAWALLSSTCKRRYTQATQSLCAYEILYIRQRQQVLLCLHVLGAGAQVLEFE